MTALPLLVLAGGRGTRLHPLTLDLPKPLFPLVGRTLIERVIEPLVATGAVSEVVLSTGYGSEAFLPRFESECCGVPCRVLAEPQPRGTGGALGFARGLLRGTAAVANGDALAPIDLRAMLELHRSTGAAATVALIRVDDPTRYGMVETEGQFVRAFVEKPPPERVTTDRVNGGLYLLEPEVLEGIPGDRECSIEREVFPALLREGRIVAAFLHEGYFLDLGTPERYLQAHADLLEGTAGYDLGPPARPGVWTGGPVEILPGARVQGPVWLGPGVRIAGTVLGPASLGAGTAVEAGATVERSVLWDRCRIAAGARVEGAVLGAGVVARASLGPGALVRSGRDVMDPA